MIRQKQIASLLNNFKSNFHSAGSDFSRNDGNIDDTSSLLGEHKSDKTKRHSPIHTVIAFQRMSDSGFEFEEDDGDSYDDIKSAQGENAGANHRFIIENAFYEAEDAMVLHPEEAEQKFRALCTLLESQTPDEKDAKSVYQWHSKALHNLVRLPITSLEDRKKYVTKLFDHMENVKGTESAMLSLSALEVFEDRVLRGQAENDAAAVNVLKDVYAHAIKTCRALSNSKSWRNLNFQLINLLMRFGLHHEVEAHICSLYADWLDQQTSGIERCGDAEILDKVALFTAVDGASPEDSYLLQIITADLEFCASMGIHTRPLRLLKVASDPKRALMEKRTLKSLREHVGLLYFVQGHFTEAYKAIFDAWEINFSLGNMKEARELLLLVLTCTILSESTIDPLTTREATTLLGGADALEFKTDVHYLVQLRESVVARDVQQTHVLLKERSCFDSNPVYERAGVRQRILELVRTTFLLEACGKWTALTFEWIREKLCLPSDPLIVTFFVIQFIEGHSLSAKVDGNILRNYRRDEASDTLKRILDGAEGMLRVVRASKE